MVGRPTEEDEEVFEFEPDLVEDIVPLRLEHDVINIMNTNMP
jgi:hypothetical protein